MIAGRSWAWLAGAALVAGGSAMAHDEGPFQRIASFPVFRNTDIDTQTVSEIVAAANGGNTLIYTDSAGETLGFVDISDPANPQPDGVVALAGEPTSVGVNGDWVLACVNTSPDFVNPSGQLDVIDLASRNVLATFELGGQPDAIAVSPDGRYAAIAIENERDEDLGDGEPPQLPGGFLVIVDMVGSPANWSLRTVDLTGLAALFPEDPEPEYVDINIFNVCVVTLQENNHIVLVHLPTGTILDDFSAGNVDLDGIDTEEEDVIDPTSSLADVPREPDAVAWISPLTFATANEGDLFGGSRGFTTWLGSHVLYDSGNEVEHVTIGTGHYPEARSENKGNEPESVEFGRYGHHRYLFVGSERASVVLVYELRPFGGPQLRQVLPSGLGPEGLLAIPERDLFVVASEEDSREDKVRSLLTVYARTGHSTYPTVVSAQREGESHPIPWGALSGMARRGNRVLSVHDSFYKRSRVFEMNVDQVPAVIQRERELNDADGRLRSLLNDLKAQLPGTDDFEPGDIVNEDGSVNLDLEGVESRGRNLWFASEGAGNLVDGVSDPDDQPFASPNLLIRTNRRGQIREAIALPLELVRNQFRFGFEGVAARGRFVYVAFQRSWSAAGDLADHARIGRYDRRRQEWTFAYYPLSSPTSANGGWVGLSEITSLGRGEFLVAERDNQGGDDATIKQLTTISLRGVRFRPHSATPNFDVFGKSTTLDLLASDVYGPGGGVVPEKLEGVAVLPGGDVLIVNDNDGVDDSNGETQLLRIEGLID